MPSAFNVGNFDSLVNSLNIGELQPYDYTSALSEISSKITQVVNAVNNKTVTLTGGNVSYSGNINLPFLDTVYVFMTFDGISASNKDLYTIWVLNPSGKPLSMNGYLYAYVWQDRQYYRDKLRSSYYNDQVIRLITDGTDPEPSSSFYLNSYSIAVDTQAFFSDNPTYRDVYTYMQGGIDYRFNGTGWSESKTNGVAYSQAIVQRSILSIPSGIQALINAVVNLSESGSSGTGQQEVEVVDYTSALNTIIALLTYDVVTDVIGDFSASDVRAATAGLETVARGVFPFALAYVVADLLGNFDVASAVPEYDIPVPDIWNHTTVNMHLDFSQFSMVRNVTSFACVLFLVLGLAMATRRFVFGGDG